MQERTQPSGLMYVVPPCGRRLIGDLKGRCGSLADTSLDRTADPPMPHTRSHQIQRCEYRSMSMLASIRSNIGDSAAIRATANFRSSSYISANSCSAAWGRPAQSRQDLVDAGHTGCRTPRMSVERRCLAASFSGSVRFSHEVGPSASHARASVRQDNSPFSATSSGKPGVFFAPRLKPLPCSI